MHVGDLEEPPLDVGDARGAVDGQDDDAGTARPRVETRLGRLVRATGAGRVDDVRAIAQPLAVTAQA